MIYRKKKEYLIEVVKKQKLGQKLGCQCSYFSKDGKNFGFTNPNGAWF